MTTRSFQRTLPRYFVTLFLLTIVILPSSAKGDEDYDGYLSALLADGYPDLVADWLMMKQQSGVLPERLAERLDYELGRCRMLQAQSAPAEMERKYTDEALEYFRSYVAKHPGTDEAIEVRNRVTSIMIRRGQIVLARAGAAKTQEEARALYQEARKLFEEVQKDAVQTAEQFQAALDEMPEKATKVQRRLSRAVAMAEERRLRLMSGVIRAEVNQGILAFFLATTYDAKDEKRTELFNEAAKRFDAMFQRYRHNVALVDLYSLAHLWHAKVLHEQGQLLDALDIYDEVLVNEPLPGANNRSLEEVVVQAYLGRYQIMNARGRHEQILNHPIWDVEVWARSHSHMRESPYYLGVVLEGIKAMLALASKEEEGTRKRRVAFTVALRKLDEEVLRYDSPYLNEAFELRNNYLSEIKTKDGELASFDEAVFMGDSSLGAQKWEEATEFYRSAMSMADKRTDPSKKADAQFRLVYASYKAGKLNECIKAGDSLAREFAGAKVAPQGAGIALLALYRRWAAAEQPDEKKADGQRLLEFADYLETTWPEVSQADQSKQIRGVVYMTQQDFAKAAAAYTGVDEDSPLFPQAQLQAGKAYWSEYTKLVSNSNQEGGEESSQAILEQALAALDASIARQKLKMEPTMPKPAELVEAELTKAEILLRTKGHEHAKGLIEPLVPLAMDEGRKDLEPLRVRLLVAGLELAVSQQNLAEADRLLEEMTKLGGSDSTRITRVLVQLGKGIEQQVKQLQAAGRNTEADRALQSYRDFLARLASRENQDYFSLRYLSDSYFELADYARAAEIFERMLDMIGAGSTSLTESQAATETRRIRLMQLRSRRMSKQYSQALKQVETLLAEHSEKTFPLHLMEEKGLILEGLAGSDRSKLQEALAHWNGVARILQAGSPKPPAYFEARLHMAQCFASMGREQDADQVLRSTLALNPKCGGPEMKRRFETMLSGLSQ